MHFLPYLKLCLLIIGIFSFSYLGGHISLPNMPFSAFAREFELPGDEEQPGDEESGEDVPGEEGIPELPLAKIEITIERSPICELPGTPIQYIIRLTNVGGRSAVNVTLRNRHPKMPIDSINPAPQSYNPSAWLITWFTPIIRPQESATFSFRVPRILDRVDNRADVEYFSTTSQEDVLAGPFTAEAYEMVSDPCSPDIAGEPAPTMPTKPRRGLAVIICAPQETSCTPFMPSLGLNFQSAKPPGPNTALGVRYREAIADIIPGECRVIEDDIIITPEYHNSLNRAGNSSAVYIRPLFQSTQDFKRLVQENILLGIKHNLYVRTTLQQIHTKHWQIQARDIRRVLSEDLQAQSISINAYHRNWQNETREAQIGIANRYESMQANRKQKFNPIAAAAIRNAQLSIIRACGSDEGIAETLRPALLAVRERYEASLDNRASIYEETQRLFADPEGTLLSWQDILRDALREFDRGNPRPLELYLDKIAHFDQGGFSAGWEQTYKRHTTEDEIADNQIRLEFWNKALEDPKTKATDCAKEDLFKHHVVTTWCESGDYPELVLRNAPLTAKKRANTIFLPDTSDLDGTDATVTETSGEPCVPEPGNPWWADDCSCECDDMLDEEPGPYVCQNFDDVNITRHDYFVTSPEECLNEGDKHDDPWF